MNKYVIYAHNSYHLQTPANSCKLLVIIDNNCKLFAIKWMFAGHLQTAANCCKLLQTFCDYEWIHAMKMNTLLAEWLKNLNEWTNHENICVFIVSIKKRIWIPSMPHLKKDREINPNTDFSTVAWTEFRCVFQWKQWQHTCFHD